MSLSLTLVSNAQDFSEYVKVVADDRDTEDRFGWSVDIDGDFAIVGAYADDYGATNPNMGAAYIYEKIGDDWIQIQKLSNSDQDDYDRFGWSVAIDGDYCIVGAYGEDHNEFDEDDLSKAGSAYIFERNVDDEWIEVQKLVAFDRAADDEFGWSVAIHGTTAVVGAHQDDKDEIGGDFMYHAGSAYIFDRGGDGDWNFSQKIVASDRSPGTVFDPEHEDWNDRFGESVGIWNDYLIVGGPFASKAYMYERSGGTWSEVAFLTYPGISWLDRAAPVSIDGTTAVLGASTEDHDEFGGDHLMNSGGAAIFKRNDAGTWYFAQKIVASDRSAGDHFGISISIDGDYIAVGAHQDNHDELTEEDLENAGSIYVFELQDDGTFLEQTKLDASDREIEDQLGISISVSGNTLISGAFQQDYTPAGATYLEDAGAAYFYSTLEGGGGGGCTTVYYTQEAEICSGDSFDVGGSSYSESGVYEDIIVMDDGCDSIVTTVLNVLDEIIVEQEFFLCPGESITVGDNTYDETGFYIDEFISAMGCDSIVFTFVAINDPINTDVDQDGLTFEANATGVEYQWVTCDPMTEIPGANDASYTASEDGWYAVIIYDGDCADTSDCYEINTSGIADNIAYNVSVYPNPSNGIVNISTSFDGNATIQLYNTIGQTIYEGQLQSGKAMIDLRSTTEKGLYILEINFDGQVYTDKVIIE